MKTEAYFSIHCDTGLTAAQYRQVQLFAELIPAEVFQDRTSNHRNIHVSLDAVLDSTPGGLCVAVSRKIDIGDLLRWNGESLRALQDRIRCLRKTLFIEIGVFVEQSIERAAPPMPPEPEPVYVSTGLTFKGRSIALESTGNDKMDRHLGNAACRFLYNLLDSQKMD